MKTSKVIKEQIAKLEQDIQDCQRQMEVLKNVLPGAINATSVNLIASVLQTNVDSLQYLAERIDKANKEIRILKWTMEE